MQLGMQQVQKLSQRLVMTPQMQQSVKLLQMNTLELEALAQQEILENPFLEMEDEDSDEVDYEREAPADEATAVREKTSEDESDGEEAAQRDDYETSADAKTTQTDEGDEGDAAAVDEQPEQFSEVDANWEEVFEDGQTYRPPTRKDEEDERSFEETVAGRQSLYEKLHWQLRVSALEGRDYEIGAYLIGSLNESGYLETAVPFECAEHFGVEIEEVERILRIVQEFEPAGVAARSIPESLLLQLDSQGDLTPLAEQVLNEHWQALMKKKFREIARACDVEEEAVLALFHRIQRLDPAPGRHFTKEQTVYVTPDVYVRKMDGAYTIYMHEGQVAHLRLSKVYKDLLIHGPQDGQDAKDREYALEKYRGAVMFIKNIERRRNTVLRVTEAIMEYQEEFLEKGVQALRPLALSEIAEKVGLHESTISRVTSGKYVDTPQGLFELKYFFSSAISFDNGEAASSRSVKQKIQEIIANEDPRKPLSDEKIAKTLKALGFNLARRTVAKYREQMRILPTNLRRKTD